MKKIIIIVFLLSLVINLFAFRFAVVGDNRPNNPHSGQPKIYQRILWEIDKLGVDFVINTGDIITGYGDKTEKATEKEFKKFRQVMDENLSCPWYVAAGNHDYAGKGAQKLFFKYVGKKMISFAKDDSYFIILNTSSKHTSKGTLNPAKYYWLIKQLKKAEGYDNLFIAFHHPLKFNTTYVKRRTWASDYWKNKLIEALEKAPNKNKYVLEGHNHYFDYYFENGVNYMICGGGGARLYLPPQHGGFFHYVIFDVQGDKVSYKVIIPYTFDVKIKKINEWQKEIVFYNNLAKPNSKITFRGIKVKMPKANHYVLQSKNKTAKILKIESLGKRENLITIAFTPITGKYGNVEYEKIKVKALK